MCGKPRPNRHRHQPVSQVSIGVSLSVVLQVPRQIRFVGVAALPMSLPSRKDSLHLISSACHSNFRVCVCIPVTLTCLLPRRHCVVFLTEPSLSIALLCLVLELPQGTLTLKFWASKAGQTHVYLAPQILHTVTLLNRVSDEGPQQKRRK